MMLLLCSIGLSPCCELGFWSGVSFLCHCDCWEQVATIYLDGIWPGDLQLAFGNFGKWARQFGRAVVHLLGLQSPMGDGQSIRNCIVQTGI